MSDHLEGSEDLWHVETSTGAVLVVTLDQLDEAFQAGQVNERTRVWQEGMPSAMALGDLLGGGEDDVGADSAGLHEDTAPEAPSFEDAPPPQARYQLPPQPTLIGLSAPEAQPAPLRASMRPPSVALEAQPAPLRASMWPPSIENSPRVTVAPSPVPAPSAPPPVSRRPVVSETAGAWPPVVTRSATPPAGNSDSLRPVVGPSVPPPSLPSNAMPLSFDIDEPPFARRSGKGKVVGAIVVLAAAASVAFAVNSGALTLPSNTETPAVAAAPPPPAPEPPKSHAFDPGSAPVHLREAPPPVVITTRENEEKNLASAVGKKLGVTTSKAAPKPAVHAAARPHRTGNTGGSFKSHGKSNVYDPLNGAL